MLTVEEKFERFTQLALREAAAKRDDILNQLDTYRNEKINEAESECLENSYKIVQSGVSKAKNEAHKIVSQEPADCKKKLFELRESLISELFAELTQKVKQFKDSDDYSNFLINKISEAVSGAGEGKKRIIIDKTDEKYSSEIEQKFNCLVEFDEKLIGGCIVENMDSKKIFNNSISDKISELRANFLQDSKFSIY